MFGIFLIFQKIFRFRFFKAINPQLSFVKSKTSMSIKKTSCNSLPQETQNYFTEFKLAPSFNCIHKLTLRDIGATGFSKKSGIESFL